MYNGDIQLHLASNRYNERCPFTLLAVFILEEVKNVKFVITERRPKLQKLTDPEMLTQKES